MIIFFSLSKEVFIFDGGKRDFLCPFYPQWSHIGVGEIVGYICVIGSPTRNKLKNFKNDKI